MKTVLNTRSNTLSSLISTQSLTIVSLFAGTLLLNGCQSTGSNQSMSSATTNTPAAAKTTLADALQKQRRSSFSYHSNVEISPIQQLDNVDTSELSATGQLETYCEDTHDKAYSDLLDVAEANNDDISAVSYDNQRDTIELAFNACSKAYRTWDNNQYLAPSEETSKKPVSDYYQQIFDNYATETSALDVKRAQLLDAYLLKPLSLNAQGVYQPLAGRFTMLMSAQYYARNNHSSINQPIYIDLKAGNIYLWADNFALVTSEFADDKLGAKWENKWLKLAIDDGSLPKGFGRSVVEAHFAALDRTYETAPVEQFSFITPNTLTTVLPKVTQPHLAVMNQTQQIVRREQSAISYEQFYSDYLVVFYDLLATQYPELVIDEDSPQSDMLDDEESMLTSKALVQQVLSIMKTVIDRQADNLINDVYYDTIQTDDILADSDDLSTQPSIQMLYGLDRRGKIQWQYQRSQYSNDDKSVKGINVDVLQQYAPVASAVSFPNLPANQQIPNASNSVDLREYSRELVEYYHAGNGTAIGKMLYRMLPANNEINLSELEVEEYEEPMVDIE